MRLHSRLSRRTFGLIATLGLAASVLVVSFPDGPERTPKLPNQFEWIKRTYPHMQADPNAMGQAVEAARSMRQRRNPSDYGEWHDAGPLNIGGRIVDIEFDSALPQLVYAAAATGGVFRSTDTGLSWTPIFDDVAALTVGDIALVPSDPMLLYVGTGEANGGHNNMPGGGMYKSTNAGLSWDSIGLENTASIGRVVVDPRDSDRVFVAAVGSYFSPNPERGVYRTTNGGESWEQSLFVSDSTGAIDVVMDPSQNDILYAAMWERVRRPNSSHLYGPTGGIHKTTDGGNTWTELGAAQGLPDPSNTRIGRIGLTIHQANPNILYALYNDGANYLGLFRTDDGGENWVDADPSDRIAEGTAGFSWYFGQVRVHPTNPDIVYALDVAFMRSTNGGATWPIIDGYGGPEILHVDHHALAFHPENPAFILEGNDGGINISTNGGEDWTKVAELPITQFYEIGLDASHPERLYGGTQDNGTLRTVSGGLSSWEAIFGGDGFYVNVHPTNPNIIYAESQFGFLGKSIDGGDDWEIVLDGIDEEEPTNWSTPVVMSPHDPDVLYYGTDRVYRTTNGASRWKSISPDLSDGLPNTRLGTVTTIAPAPSRADVIYAGTDDANVWVTTNDGDNWSRVSEGLPQRWVTRIAVDPGDWRVACVTYSGLKWKDPEPHVFRTTDAGVTWRDISGDLPQIPLNALALDPADPNVIFVGADAGAYVTTDLGHSWEALGTGMPLVAIYDMKVHPKTRVLVAGTHARSMYRLYLPPVTGPGAPRRVLARPGDARVDLGWPANPEPSVIRYHIYRSQASPATVLVDSVSAGPDSLTWADLDVQNQTTYYYRVRAVDDGGLEGLASAEVSATPTGEVGLENDVPAPPLNFNLFQNHPNPFNPRTVLRFSLPAAGQVRLTIYDQAGHRVRRLVDGHRDAGEHRVHWDGTKRSGAHVSSGVYISVLEFSDHRQMRRMVLAK